MMDSKSHEPFLEIAIQTVLHKYRDQLANTSLEDQQELFKVMADEINTKAIQYKKITNLTLEQLNDD